jgi:hypothetical protein
MIARYSVTLSRNQTGLRSWCSAASGIHQYHCLGGRRGGELGRREASPASTHITVTRTSPGNGWLACQPSQPLSGPIGGDQARCSKGSEATYQPLDLLLTYLPVTCRLQVDCNVCPSCERHIVLPWLGLLWAVQALRHWGSASGLHPDCAMLAGFGAHSELQAAAPGRRLMRRTRGPRIGATA